MCRSATLPKISVVIPTHNRAVELERCLDSLVEQTFKNFEVWVCDDGSTDNTSKVVQSYLCKLNVHYNWNKNFGGPARPRNIGWRLANAEYIAFLDSDDWWSPKKLEESILCLEDGADFVYHQLYLVKSEFQKFNWRKVKTHQLCSPVFQYLVTNGNIIPNSSVVVRKSLLEKVQGLSEESDMVAMEDYDCWLRIAKHTERFLLLDKTLGYYWAGGGNITSPERTLKLMDLLRKRYLQGFSDYFPAWFHYTMGKSLYQTACYKEAIPHLYKTFFNNKALMMKLKTILMMIATILRLLIKFPQNRFKSFI